MASKNPNLTPTPTVDKNGRLTTVHKRQQGASTAGKAIPAPSTPTSSSQGAQHPDERTRKQVLHDLMVVNNRNREISSNKQYFLVRLDEKQTESVIDALSNKKGFGSMMNPMLDKMSSGQIAGAAELYEPDMFSYARHPDLKPAQNGGVEAGEYYSLYHYLRVVPELELDTAGANDIPNQPVEKIEKARSYARLFSAVRNTNPQAVPDKALIDLLFEKDRDPQEVIKAVKENGTHDPQVIRGILEGAQKSVASGWL